MFTAKAVVGSSPSPNLHQSLQVCGSKRLTDQSELCVLPSGCTDHLSWLLFYIVSDDSHVKVSGWKKIQRAASTEDSNPQATQRASKTWKNTHDLGSTGNIK